MPKKTEIAPARKDGLVDVPFNDSKPEGLDIAVGDSITGTLGPVKQGTDMQGAPRPYRLLTNDDGNFYLNSNADLERKHIFDMPVGTTVCLTRTEDVQTKYPNPMKTFAVAAPQSVVDALPF